MRSTSIMCLVVFLVACTDTVNEPSPETSGLSFKATGAQQSNFNAAGQVSATPDGSVLNSEFAVAQRDSLGGVVIIGYQPAGAGKGDIFIVQLPLLRTGTFACGQMTDGCHARYYTGVTNGELTTVERAFFVSAGSVSITAAGPERMQGTFSVTLKNQDGSEAVEIENGVIDVPMKPGEVGDGAIACLISLTGAGTGTCRV